MFPPSSARFHEHVHTGPPSSRSGSMAFGNVFVFNLCSESVTLRLNGQGSVGSIAYPSPRSGYAPSSLTVGRTNLTRSQLNSPLFAMGDNFLEIQTGGLLWQGNITIPAPPRVPLQSDLGLYLAYKRGVLVNFISREIVGEFNAS